MSYSLFFQFYGTGTFIYHVYKTHQHHTCIWSFLLKGAAMVHLFEAGLQSTYMYRSETQGSQFSGALPGAPKINNLSLKLAVTWAEVASEIAIAACKLRTLETHYQTVPTAGQHWTELIYKSSLQHSNHDLWDSGWPMLTLSIVWWPDRQMTITISDGD